MCQTRDASLCIIAGAAHQIQTARPQQKDNGKCPGREMSALAQSQGTPDSPRSPQTQAAALATTHGIETPNQDPY